MIVANYRFSTREKIVMCCSATQVARNFAKSAQTSRLLRDSPIKAFFAYFFLEKKYVVTFSSKK